MASGGVDYADQSVWPADAALAAAHLAPVRTSHPHWFAPIPAAAREHTDDFPLVDQPAPADGEALVPVEHPGIVCLASYDRVGLPGSCATTRLRSGVAVLLGEVADALPAPFGLAVFDAWRSPDLQRWLYEQAAGGHEAYISVPSTDPRTPAPHVTGGTVDVTLTFEGQPLSLGTAFDDFGALAHPHGLEQVGAAGAGDAAGRPHWTDDELALLRDLRRLLFNVMTGSGFVVYPLEWWHYEYGTRRWAFHTGNVPLYGSAD